MNCSLINVQFPVFSDIFVPPNGVLSIYSFSCYIILCYVILYYIITKLTIITIYAPNEDNGATLKDTIIIIRLLHIIY